MQRGLSRNTFIILMLTPTAILLLGVTLFPFLTALVMSFTNYSLIRPDELAWIGFDNYRNLLASEEFWRAFATTAAVTLHIVMRRGRNTHHIVEASFKGVARALRDAVRVEGSALPSTKGTL